MAQLAHVIVTHIKDNRSTIKMLQALTKADSMPSPDLFKELLLGMYVLCIVSSSGMCYEHAREDGVTNHVMRFIPLTTLPYLKVDAGISPTPGKQSPSDSMDFDPEVTYKYTVMDYKSKQVIPMMLHKPSNSPTSPSSPSGLTFSKLGGDVKQTSGRNSVSVAVDTRFLLRQEKDLLECSWSSAHPDPINSDALRIMPPHMDDSGSPRAYLRRKESSGNGRDSFDEPGITPGGHFECEHPEVPASKHRELYESTILAKVASVSSPKMELRTHARAYLETQLPVTQRILIIMIDELTEGGLTNTTNLAVAASEGYQFVESYSLPDGIYRRLSSLPKPRLRSIMTLLQNYYAAIETIAFPFPQCLHQLLYYMSMLTSSSYTVLQLLDHGILTPYPCVFNDVFDSERSVYGGSLSLSAVSMQPTHGAVTMLNDLLHSEPIRRRMIRRVVKPRLAHMSDIAIKAHNKKKPDGNSESSGDHVRDNLESDSLVKEYDILRSVLSNSVNPILDCAPPSVKYWSTKSPSPWNMIPLSACTVHEMFALLPFRHLLAYSRTADGANNLMAYQVLATQCNILNVWLGLNREMPNRYKCRFRKLASKDPSVVQRFDTSRPMPEIGVTGPYPLNRLLFDLLGMFLSTPELVDTDAITNATGDILRNMAPGDFIPLKAYQVSLFGPGKAGGVLLRPLSLPALTRQIPQMAMDNAIYELLKKIYDEADDI